MPVAGRIGCEREEIAIVARGEFADRKIFVALRHLVLVEQHFGSGAILCPAAEVRRILLSLLGPVEIPILAILVRYGCVVLFYASEHFLVQRVDEWLMPAHKGLGIGLVVLEVLDYLRVFFVRAVAQPRVVVGDLITVDLQNLGHFFCNGCFHDLLPECRTAGQKH